MSAPVASKMRRPRSPRAIEPPVTAPAQPVDLAVARRHLDRRGAVIGGEVVAIRERETSRTQPITVAAMTCRSKTWQRWSGWVAEPVIASSPVSRLDYAMCCDARAVTHVPSLV